MVLFQNYANFTANTAYENLGKKKAGPNPQYFFN